jgi:hypothetical protein
MRTESTTSDVATPTARESSLAMESAVAHAHAGFAPMATERKRKRPYASECSGIAAEESRRKRLLLLGAGPPIDEHWSDEGVVGGVEGDDVQEVESMHNRATLFECAAAFGGTDARDVVDDDDDDVWGHVRYDVWGHVRFPTEPAACFARALGFMDADDEALLADDARVDDGADYGESSEICGGY